MTYDSGAESSVSFGTPAFGGPDQAECASRRVALPPCARRPGSWRERHAFAPSNQLVRL